MFATPELCRRIFTVALCLFLVGHYTPAQTPRHRALAPPASASQIARRVLPSVVLLTMEGGCFGSGFFITQRQILTNRHVVTCSASRRGQVKVAGGKQAYPTKMIVAWTELDVALVEAEGLTAPPLELDTTRRLAVGDDIFVAGNPEGLEGTFTRGIISGVRSESGLLQIDAPVSPGSSGGPVIDAYGKVVGITVSSLREGQNLNFAIPAALLATPIARMQQLLARQHKEGNTTTAAGAEAHPSTALQPAQPALLSPARRTWEANHDWGDFVSETVGDTIVKDELKALLDSGLDVNTRDRGGRALMQLAAVLGQTELARYLRARGADINAIDRLGRTPLMLAVGPGDFKLSNSSLAPLGDFWHEPPCGAAADSTAARHETSWPMWYAIAARCRSIIDFLLEAGADLTAVDNLRRTVFDHAAEGGLTGFERLLHVPGKANLPAACNVSLADAPALRGLRLGLSATEVSTRLGGLRPTPRRCGLSRLFVYGSQLSALGREFEGVNSVALVLLDNRVVSVQLSYGREFPFASFDDFLAMLSASLGLPSV